MDVNNTFNRRSFLEIERLMAVILLSQVVFFCGALGTKQEGK